MERIALAATDDRGQGMSDVRSREMIFQAGLSGKQNWMELEVQPGRD